MDRVEMAIVINVAEEDIRDILLSEHGTCTAKKPLDTWENDIERRRHHLCRWACPKCGAFIGFENLHCTTCGQKIKWELIG